MYYNKIVCDECKTESLRFETFNIIQLGIPKTGSTNISDCFKRFSNTETLTGDEQSHCECCKKKTDTHKTIYVWEPPEVLFIHLKRFGVKKQHGQYVGHKVYTSVNFPIKGLTLNDNYPDIRQLDYSYDLVGAVNHTGGLEGGHYTSCARNPISNDWYKFDDLRGRAIISDTQLKDKLQDDAYLLIYKRNKGT